MAIGDKEDFIKRLKHVLPPWFGDDYPLLEAFLEGFATLDAYLWTMLSYVQAQMRIQTSTGPNLDLEACDYFGDYVVRSENMDDEVFRKLILSTLLEQLATPYGMRNAIHTLTGIYPDIWEPFSGTAGAYNIATWAYNGPGAYGAIVPYNFWITVYVRGNIMEKFGAYNNPTWGYNELNPPSNGAYGATSLYSYTLTYDQILAVINRVKVGGTVPHLTVVYL